MCLARKPSTEDLLCATSRCLHASMVKRTSSEITLWGQGHRVTTETIFTAEILLQQFRNSGTTAVRIRSCSLSAFSSKPF